MTLTDFLLARIAEDEANLAPWQEGSGVMGRHEYNRFRKHVLAECEAKRAIVNAYLEQITPDEDGFANHREDDTFGWFDANRTYHHGTIGMEFSDGAFVALRNACRALALPYADHPDFDPAWRDTPET